MSVLTITLADVVHACDAIAELIRQDRLGAADEAKREAGPVFSEFFAIPGNLALANAQSAICFERNTVNLIDVQHTGLRFAIRV